MCVCPFCLFKRASVWRAHPGAACQKVFLHARDDRVYIYIWRKPTSPTVECLHPPDSPFAHSTFLTKSKNLDSSRALLFGGLFLGLKSMRTRKSSPRYKSRPFTGKERKLGRIQVLAKKLGIPSATGINCFFTQLEKMKERKLVLLNKYTWLI